MSPWSSLSTSIPHFSACGMMNCCQAIEDDEENDENARAGSKRPRLALYPDAINPYHVLQVRRDATSTELRESYQRLALWHHPGRFTDKEEQERRSHMFHIISACYETLQDNVHRQRYDLIVYQIERNFLLGGEILIRGKPLFVPWTFQKTSGQRFVDLCASSPKPRDNNTQIPVLLSSSSSTTTIVSDDDLTLHAPDDASHDRGPLELLYKARRWQPFTNPYTMFDYIFSSCVFARHVNDGSTPQLFHTTPTRLTKTTALQTGATKKHQDGCWVTVTSRIVQDRKLTQTECVMTQSGKQCVSVKVDSEPWYGGSTGGHDNHMSKLQCCPKQDVDDQCFHLFPCGTLPTTGK